MKLLGTLLLASVFTFTLAADEHQLTVHKVQLSGPSGTINGKVVGFADHLIFIDDDSPEKSFHLQKGEIRTSRMGPNSAIIVEMTRPVTDRYGSRSNLEIRVADPSSSAVLTKWIGVPDQRSRTETTYSIDVRHDHKGQGGCEGKLMADDSRLRFESLGEAAHSKNWNYNQLSKFEVEKDNALVKVTGANGEAVHFNVVNGATAGAMYKLVADKIVAARPSN